MTIRRLSIYSRCLAQLDEDGVKTVSSQELAERFHLNSAQVRKDLAYFGEFGIRGIGYYVSNLRAELQRLLGLDREWRVVLVGFGNLGSALFHYRGFARQGFRVAAIVDDDPAKAGRAVDALSILPLGELPRVVKQAGIQIGVVAVPAEAAQGVADRLVAAGLVERRPGVDGRTVSLHLTATGDELWQRQSEARLRWLDATMTRLRPEDRADVERVVSALLATVTGDFESSERICRLCDERRCPQDRCPVTLAVS